MLTRKQWSAAINTADEAQRYELAPMNAELKMLEKAFQAEVERRLPFQTKAAMAKRLVSQGLLAPMTEYFGNPPMQARVDGYQLTHAGRMYYFSQCVEFSGAAAPGDSSKESK